MFDQSLREAIANTINAWCLEHEEFPVAFIAAVDIAGNNEPLICALDEQPTHRSMGLAAYMNEWYRDDAQNMWQGIWASGDED